MIMTTILVGIGCFCTGLIVGVVFRDALELLRQQGVKMPSSSRAQWIISNLTLVLLFAVVILQGAVGIALIITKNDLSQTVQCQASYNQQFSQAYKHRLAASTFSRNKLDRVFFTVLDAMRSDDPEDDRQFRQALAEYVKAEKQLNRERRTNPYPPLPNTYCDRF